MRVCSILFSVFLIFAASAINISAQSLPKLPFSDRGACPFECCTYRTWVARRSLPLRREMRQTSPIVFRIKRGESVEGLTGVVITAKAGVVEVLRDTKFGSLNLRRGSRLYTLTYLGEGFYKVWYRGKFYEEDVLGNRDFKIVSEPKSVWWVKIKNKKGRTGWTDMSDSFDNQDACG